MLRVLNDTLPVIEALLGADGQGGAVQQKGFVLSTLEMPVFSQAVVQSLCLAARSCVVFNAT